MLFPCVHDRAAEVVTPAGSTERIILRRVTDVQTAALLMPLLDTYVGWVVESWVAAHGLQYDDLAPIRRRHNDVFRDDIPLLLAPPGRLLMACCGTRVFGCGALLPVDATTGEVKRMYVEPGHRGHGVGRAILQRLLDGARADGFDRIRLETSAVVMAPALRMYRSLGFVETGPFPESELVMEGLAHLTTYMHLDLRPADPVSKAPHS